MKYKIHYYCISDVGKCRRMNQDNFICEGRYIKDSTIKLQFPLSGFLNEKVPSVIGVFDGMGGEEQGEMASLIAAETAAATVLNEGTVDELSELCSTANKKITAYASEHEIRTMGTTAAILAFNREGISLCNIGDSKIFQYADKKLVQISKDHCGFAAYGVKPPLSQYLGIPEEEMLIEPYVAKGIYNSGDIYLICSDGLTDMVTTEEITDILKKSPFEQAAESLMEAAKLHGGKDNITIILCRIERARGGLFDRLLLYAGR